MRNGDCSVNVYWVCSTTAATPIPAAKRRSSSKSLAGIRRDFDRLPRARLVAGAVRDIGRHLWVEWIAKKKGVAEALFDQITTTGRHRTGAAQAEFGDAARSW